MNRTIIFDFDGVLANSEIIALAELQACLADYGVDYDWNDLVAIFLGASLKQITGHITERTGRDVHDEFQREWYRRLFERYERELQPIAGASALLDRLDAAGINYCIASGGSYERLGIALNCIGLAERFTGRAFSADSVAHGKPAPDLFLFAAKKLGVEPGHCLVIEDATAGVLAAKRADIRVLGFVGGDHLKGIRDEHAQRLIATGAAEILTSLADFDLAAFEELPA